ncbi:Hypothetical_protein [Hexamita inflata]|uniref:Hypothetical_protein n=1 Tax=Hexamita inflata TaxID=28002 RepID=A0AA86QTA1_9EUKA|nr:Hypothetical protein HINF_LOCUS51905 [Hexamita inflata]
MQTLKEVKHLEEGDFIFIVYKENCTYNQIISKKQGLTTLCVLQYFRGSKINILMLFLHIFIREVYYEFIKLIITYFKEQKIISSSITSYFDLKAMQPFFDAIDRPIQILGSGIFSSHQPSLKRNDQNRGY